MMRNVVPLVLHQIVPDGSCANFEDIEVSMLRRILDVCQGRCVHVEERSAPDDPFDRCYLLTFDDGNLSDFEIALPLLKEKDCSASFFIVTEKIGTQEHLSWSQVRELHDAGMMIGSHSASHPDMRSLPLSRQREELLSSRLCIEDKLGAAITAFSFPFGKFNKSLIELAWNAGYREVYTSKHGVTEFPASLLPRNSINSSMSWESVSETLNASALARFKWGIEDIAKDLIQLVGGDNVYCALRSIWFRRR